MAENKTEFNLSEKIGTAFNDDRSLSSEVIPLFFVKEFIRLLKEELYFEMVEKEAFISYSKEAFERDIKPIIDKLAGDKLI